MDALSEVLKAIRLDGAMYVSATFTEPWCVEAHFGFASASPSLPVADHNACFHVLIKGRCLTRLVDEREAVEVSAADAPCRFTLSQDSRGSRVSMLGAQGMREGMQGHGTMRFEPKGVVGESLGAHGIAGLGASEGIEGNHDVETRLNWARRRASRSAGARALMVE
ncbi:MAG TPA: cupin domain-containing protein [Steroidobacteraceae bacterium]|nr:cupin domain-containing protein [Steroidobacteraceae bacterium]